MDTVTAGTETLVEVTITITDENGNSQTSDKKIPSGPTKVPILKAELGVPEQVELWVVEQSGKKHQLANHETHDVKAGDHYEAIVPGGVS